MAKDSCPSCGGLKDTRSVYCLPCRFIHNHPRLGTGAGWQEHSSGYIVGCFNGVVYYQHREVMSFHLGRPLTTDEHVHHKDTIKSHNDISNLVLTDKSTHGRHHLNPVRAKEMSKLGHEARWGHSYL